MFRIADHIASAEPVGEGNHLYKALRRDGRFSAVQVFPFTITSEQYSAFTQQVNMLAEAANHHHVSIPPILSWGFTQTGNFAYIEREWIEGWDVTELPHNGKGITIDEIGDIGEQLSRVLTLCHSAGVVHGNISNKHILWDKKRQQYSLMGFRFGLPLPEAASKNRKFLVTPKGYESNLSSTEKDVHDLGVVLFQLVSDLLPGDAPALPHSAVSLSNQTLKDGNTIPAWLATCIERALSTEEEKFTGAHEMYSYIILHHKSPVPDNKWYRSKPQQPVAPIKREVRTGKTSRQKIQSAWTSGVKKGREEMRFVFDRHIAIGLLIAGVLAGFSIIAQKRENEKNREAQIAMSTSALQQDTATIRDEEATKTVDEIKTQKSSTPVVEEKKKTVTPKKVDKKEKAVEEVPAVTSTTEKEENSGDIGSYKVRGKAYFHNEPDEATRRNAFIVHWNNAVLHPLKEENDFVYVVFTNEEGQTSKGWLRKKDLVKL